MNALELKDLHKEFAGFTLDIPELVLPSGCIMGLIGENGAGKSTTIKLILGLLHPDRGSVTLLDRAGEPLALTLQDVGVVLDEGCFPQKLNADQIGAVMSGVFPNWDQALYDTLLGQFSLPWRKPFKDLSRGMKMKLSLAVALSHHPRLLVLDEATAGLDPVIRDEILDLFLDFTRSEDHSILISSHIVSDLEKLCDYIAFLHDGQLMLCEEKDRLLEEYGLIRCSAQTLADLPENAVLGKKSSPYGAEALVRRSALPRGMEAGPVDIESLFIYLSRKEDN